MDAGEVRAHVHSCSVPHALLEHGEEFRKEVIQVTPHVYVAVGFAVANSILLDAPAGLIVVDTTESPRLAAEVMTEFRRLFPDKPVKAVIYTHSHEDHIGGTTSFLPADRSGVEIWAHERFMEMVTSPDQTILRGALTPRIVRQFGMGLDKMGALVNCGIGPFNRAPAAREIVWPNRLVRGERQTVTIAGLTMELVHIPGETLCHLGVWVPGWRVFLPGDDIYKAFPNLYAIRGSVPRSVTDWIQSLDKIRVLKPEILVPSHTRPIVGQQQVLHELTVYRDGIQYVHDQTIRLMNRGWHPVEVARAVQLPASLRHEPYLQHFYGTPEWSSRAVFDAYVGWFSGAVEDLNPLTPAERAGAMLDSFGEHNVLAAAERALAAGRHQWALELASHVLLARPGAHAARAVRTKAITALASQQVSANGRNYYLTYALEDHGLHPSRYPTAYVVRTQPLSTLLAKMKATVKAEEVSGKKMTVVLVISDDPENIIVLHLRNSILEVCRHVPAPVAPDLTITLSLATLRSVLAAEAAPGDLLDAGHITVAVGGPRGGGEGGRRLLGEFFGCFELGDNLGERRQTLSNL